MLVIAVTALNAVDSPGPGMAVIRAIRESKDFEVRIIGLAYESLEPGIYMHEIVDKTYQIPYPSAGTDALYSRLVYINEIEKIDVLIPNFDAELFNFIRISEDLLKLGIHTFLPTQADFEAREKTKLSEFGRKNGFLVLEDKILYHVSVLPKAIGNSDMKIKCLAIDDEPLALEKICNYILKTSFLELVGKCKSGLEAIEILSVEKIDLLFVDIDMPGINGLDLVKSLHDKHRIIFTTALSHYAIEGFKLDALDYLLKPIGYTEFLKSANKARNYFDSIPGDSQNTSNSKSNREYLFIKSDGKVTRINFNDIVYIEGMREYVRIHLMEVKPLMPHISLHHLARQVPTHKFMRVHRSYIVNLERITMVEQNKIVIEKKTPIPVSEQYREPLQKYLNSHLLG